MKTSMQLVYFAATILCLLGTVAASDEDSDGAQQLVEGRSWGHHFMKRIGVILIPAAFVVGAVTTLLAALTMVSVKGLGVGLVLLILTIGQYIARGVPALAPTAYAAPLPPPPQFPVVYKTW